MIGRGEGVTRDDVGIGIVIIDNGWGIGGNNR